MGGFANDNGEFAFEVVLLGNSRMQQIIAICDKAAWKAREHDRFVRNLTPHFLDVRSIVDTDTENLLSGIHSARMVSFGAFECDLGLRVKELRLLFICMIAASASAWADTCLLYTSDAADES